MRSIIGGSGSGTNLLDEADKHPSAALTGPIQTLKDQCKTLADIAYAETGEEFAVSQAMKLKTTLISHEGLELDAVITLKVEAKLHVEKED